MSQAVFLTPAQLVERWNGVVAQGTLANWRSRKMGPAFIKLGHQVVYPVAHVEAWEKANLQGMNEGGLPFSG